MPGAPVAAAGPGSGAGLRIADWLEQYAAQFAFSGSIAVSHQGSTVFSRAYGLASIEHQVPNRPETRHRIWSVTKQFTAAAILLLAERGLLTVRDRLRDHFPEWTTLDGRITIDHLLAHTSGIPNYSSLPDSRHTFQRIRHERNAFIAQVTGWPLEFEPGTRWRYCNTGYYLLGLLVERLSGMPYGDFLEQHICRPLGLDGTGFDAGRRIVPGLATGYYLDGDSLVPCGYIDMALMSASGGLHSTTGDLLRWCVALTGGELLSPESLALMRTPGLNGYGYGVVIDSVSGRRLVRHSGGCEGFLSDLHHYPDDGLTVAVLSNYGFAAVERIARTLTALAFGEPAAPPLRPAPVPMAEGRLASLLGTYGDSAQTLELRRGPAPDAIEIVIDSECHLPVYPISESAFHHTWIDESYDISCGPDGQLSLWGLPKASPAAAASS